MDARGNYAGDEHVSTAYLLQCDGKLECKDVIPGTERLRLCWNICHMRAPKTCWNICHISWFLPPKIPMRLQDSERSSGVIWAICVVEMAGETFSLRNGRKHMGHVFFSTFGSPTMATFQEICQALGRNRWECPLGLWKMGSFFGIFLVKLYLDVPRS